MIILIIKHIYLKNNIFNYNIRVRVSQHNGGISAKFLPFFKFWAKLPHIF